MHDVHTALGYDDSPSNRMHDIPGFFIRIVLD